ncbi:MAG TPA: BTAD domain-containing putative transcriptional regulator [Stellaceae bacterium]|nr:BTAD domain-containing putative transcriptional regulator [Stellaceae bacterium]
MERKAQASLRRVLFDIRGALGSLGCDSVVAGRRDLILLQDNLDLDFTAMLRDIATARVPETLLVQPRAVETVLLGYEDLSPMFGEWVRGVRAQMQARLIRELEKNYENKLPPRRRRRLLAEAALLLDPVHEGACRTMMRLAAEDGEIGSALRAYANLYNSLGEELDMEPSAATQDLVVNIKQGHFDSPAQPIQPAGGSPATAMPRAGAPIVAVLPFRSIGPDSMPSYFADGVVEDTVRMLATLREPVVISTNSTREFRDYDLREVGRRLGVQYVVSGTVRTAGSRLRLSVELAEVADGSVLWSNAYDTAEPLFFEAQDDIASSIVRVLVPRFATPSCAAAAASGQKI